MAHRDPLPRWGQPTPRHEAMHVGMQHQRLTPGVERRNDPRLRAQIRGVRP